jgi:hypothetical protein
MVRSVENLVACDRKRIGTLAFPKEKNQIGSLWFGLSRGDWSGYSGGEDRTCNSERSLYKVSSRRSMRCILV